MVPKHTHARAVAMVLLADAAYIYTLMTECTNCMDFNSTTTPFLFAYSLLCHGCRE